MLFNSTQFLFFFVLVTSVYFAIPYHKRWLWLLVSSCYFYMAFVPIYIVILAFTIIVDYFSGIYIENTTGRKRKLLLIGSLVANIGTLVVFKYYNFLNEAISGLFGLSERGMHLPYLNILLPIGLSFHTFQAMSYTIEVYRGNQKAEKHFGIYALYVMFYPQLVAGPIERPQNLIHQFREKYDFDYKRIKSGLRLMAYGLFKKMVIADRLGVIVDSVYDAPGSFHGFPLIIATFFFAIQIYCDFSGYSDIAIGAARVMGFKLMRNFNNPYFSRSIAEFWTRWHISLSTWFRDYVYIPLGGNKTSRSRLYFNLMLVFLISGLWHGANWTFVIWGALNGSFLILERIISRRLKNIKVAPAISRILVFFSIIMTFMMICFSWIFFRAHSLGDAVYIIKNLFVNLRQSIPVGFSSAINLSKYNAAVIFVSFFIVVITKLFQANVTFTKRIDDYPSLVRWSLYVFIGVFILFFGIFDRTPQFIYFQF
jgi:alginate O-acetyltransferase complex protein AlgI